MPSVSVPIYHECVCDECERVFRCSGEEHAQTEERVCDECLFTAAAAAQRIIGRVDVANRFAALAKGGAA